MKSKKNGEHLLSKNGCIVYEEAEYNSRKSICNTKRAIKPSVRWSTHFHENTVERTSFLGCDASSKYLRHIKVSLFLFCGGIVLITERHHWDINHTFIITIYLVMRSPISDECWYFFLKTSQVRETVKYLRRRRSCDSPAISLLPDYHIWSTCKKMTLRRGLIYA